MIETTEYFPLQDYDEAMKFSKAILCVEPGNHQALQLTEYIENKRKKGSEAVNTIIIILKF